MIPTLTAGSALVACVQSLQLQTRNDFEVIIVDNSGQGLVRGLDLRARVIENKNNAGFGGAINQGIRASKAPFVATLNDDAVARPEWVDALLRAASDAPDIGMCASRVLLGPDGPIDSAGMLLASDGSSKQRGHGQPPSAYPSQEDVFFPSGSAALYRRKMLDEIGLFDDDFFLYCEDTDLGLRGRWSGWRCLYVPDAVVEHRYSQSAGRASALKAYLVERNRLWMAVKLFPMSMLWKVPFLSVMRYLWHLAAIRGGTGVTAEYARTGNPLQLPWFVLKAHLATLAAVPALLRKRQKVIRKLNGTEFRDLAQRHSISLKQVAAL